MNLPVRQLPLTRADRGWRAKSAFDLEPWTRGDEGVISSQAVKLAAARHPR